MKTPGKKNMNINRHNYEEYFILYWDNELTEEQKQLVKTFVEVNPDLEEEFRLLGQTRFTPDENILFESKELLARKKISFINQSDYEEWLVAYIDNELKGEEKEAVEKFIAGDPLVQQELALLQKTKLQPEEIVFPDKSVLYKTERKVRVIEMRWFRVAVAAALILVAGLVVLRLINTGNNKTEAGEIAVTGNNQTKPQEVSPDNKAGQQQTAGNNSTLSVINGADPKDNNAKLNEKENPDSNNPVASVKTNREKKSVKSTQGKENDLIAATDKPVKNQNDAVDADIHSINKPTDETVAKIDTDAPDKSFNGNTVTERNTPSYNNSDVQFASYKEDDKGGLRGFLRKATRVFERRTNVKTTTDDNKLLVGAFAVSLK